MKIIDVPLHASPYKLYIGSGILKNELLSQSIRSERVLIVSNETVAPLYLETLEKALKPIETDVVILPDGEQYKTLETLQIIFDALITQHHDRTTTVITLGGGVVCDMGGFAAACYLRGVDCVHVPTSLLAQVDASIGGKTAVNLKQAKNSVGAFHQPKAVFMDTNTLSTLDQRQFRAGLAEVVKVALLKDPVFFVWLEANVEKLLQRDQQALLHAITCACEIKRDIVVEDVNETRSTRSLLNLGHTVGHALETAMAYQGILHGEAVAIGLLIAVRLSSRLFSFPEADAVRITALLDALGLPITLPSEVTYADLKPILLRDKKVESGTQRWVLLKKIGRAVVTADVPHDEVKAVV